MVERGHEDALLVFVDFIKEAPGADAVAPGVRLPISEFLDVRPEVRLATQLRVAAAE